MSWLDTFWLHLEKGQVIRRLALFGTGYLTWITYQWTFTFIAGMGAEAVDSGLLIGAILGPVSALQGAILKFYAENPSKPEMLMQVKIDEDRKVAHHTHEDDGEK